MIDDEWWIGSILTKSPAVDQFPDSSFMCYEIRWNNGEQERMSPWDMEPVDPDRKFLLFVEFFGFHIFLVVPFRFY